MTYMIALPPNLPKYCCLLVVRHRCVYLTNYCFLLFLILTFNLMTRKMANIQRREVCERNSFHLILRIERNIHI